MTASPVRNSGAGKALCGRENRQVAERGRMCPPAHWEEDRDAAATILRFHVGAWKRPSRISN